MTRNEVDKKMKIISDALEKCPLCGGKANIIGMHTTFNDIIIDAVGCPKCNLTVERELYRMENPKRLFSKRTKSVVDVVYTWNNRQ